MNTQFYSNISDKISNATDYCNMKSFQTDLTKMFTDQLAAIQATITKYSTVNLMNLGDVISFLNSSIAPILAAANAEKAALIAKQAELTAQLTNKISDLEQQLRNQLPEGTSPDDYCSLKIPGVASSATEASPVGDRDLI
jgi:hypothetical protein